MADDPNSTADAPQTPAPPRSWLIEPGYDYRSWLQTCPNAQTLVANDPYHGGIFVIPLCCKQWSCRFCATLKCRRLAARTRDAQPNRLLTLTIDPKFWRTPREAFDATRRKIPILFNELRKRFGQVEYLRVTELTKNGWPHYHFLIRSGYLPHAVLKSQWNKLTGAQIVDIKPVDKRWSAYTYLLKYLTKMSRLEWTERHVSTSRGFFPPEPPSKNAGLPIERSEKLAMHPNTYITVHQQNSFVVRLTPSVFLVSDQLENLENACNDYAATGN